MATRRPLCCRVQFRQPWLDALATASMTAARRRAKNCSLTMPRRQAQRWPSIASQILWAIVAPSTMARFPPFVGLSPTMSRSLSMTVARSWSCFTMAALHLFRPSVPLCVWGGEVCPVRGAFKASTLRGGSRRSGERGAPRKQPFPVYLPFPQIFTPQHEFLRFRIPGVPI